LAYIDGVTPKAERGEFVVRNKRAAGARSKQD
jgi:hypothetical protein